MYIWSPSSKKLRAQISENPWSFLNEGSIKGVLVMLIRWDLGKDLVTEQQQGWGWVPVEPNRLESVWENQVLLLVSELVEAQCCRTELLTHGIWCYLQLLSEMSWVVGHIQLVSEHCCWFGGTPPLTCWNWQQNLIFPCLDSQMGLSQTFFTSLFKCHLFGQTPCWLPYFECALLFLTITNSFPPIFS